MLISRFGTDVAKIILAFIPKEQLKWWFFHNFQLLLLKKKLGDPRERHLILSVYILLQAFSIWYKNKNQKRMSSLRVKYGLLHDGTKK